MPCPPVPDLEAFGQGPSGAPLYNTQASRVTPLPKGRIPSGEHMPDREEHMTRPLSHVFPTSD